jgi:hypothetical protein
MIAGPRPYLQNCARLRGQDERRPLLREPGPARLQGQLEGHTQGSVNSHVAQRGKEQREGLRDSRGAGGLGVGGKIRKARACI